MLYNDNTNIMIALNTTDVLHFALFGSFIDNDDSTIHSHEQNLCLSTDKIS